MNLEKVNPIKTILIYSSSTAGWTSAWISACSMSVDEPIVTTKAEMHATSLV